MQLFVLGIETVNRYLDSLNIDFASFADDQAMAVSEQNHSQILQTVSAEYRSIGLIVNVDKCSSTLNGETIEFMGQ